MTVAERAIRVAFAKYEAAQSCKLVLAQPSEILICLRI